VKGQIVSAQEITIGGVDHVVAVAVNLKRKGLDIMTFIARERGNGARLETSIGRL
jgi:hypothetical protein